MYKDNIRIEAYGTLDELCSYLGFVKSSIKNKVQKDLITLIQRDLFTIGTEIAVKKRSYKRLKKRIDNNSVNRLEKHIKALESKRTIKECCFYLPGENFTSSAIDIARTVARKAERIIVTLKRKGILKNPNVLIYLNRLSDLLYLLARSYGKGIKL